MSSIEHLEIKARDWLTQDIFDSNAKLQDHVEYLAVLMKKERQRDLARAYAVDMVKAKNGIYTGDQVRKMGTHLLSYMQEVP